MVSKSTIDTFRASETSVAYDENGKQLCILKGDKDVYYLTSKELPQDAKDAMIVTEDKKFYSHNGIDVKANFRAALALMRHKEITQGASTITQQLARDIFLTQKVNIERKIKEIFVAMELEKKYNKDQILEFYLNNIYFANGYYGIEAAAKGYFSTSSKNLSLGQICFLCAIPNNPSLYDPEVRIENTIKRKNRILDQMLADKVITQTEYSGAYNETIKLKLKKETRKNYIQTFITRCATRSIMSKNGFVFTNTFQTADARKEYQERYDESYATAQKELFNSGYRIYTSIDRKKQESLQKSVDDNLTRFKDKTKDGVYKMQGAAVCIDNSTGRVVSIVGGRTQKNQGYTLNRAFQSYRQPGSSIKPLIVYTPSLERNYSPNSIVQDKKFKDGPKNSGGGYSGNITLRTAVEKSKNTVAWQLFDELSPQIGLSYLQNMNFGRIVDTDNVLAASLGGLTYGCSPLEMASGYATIENEGKYREPTCIIKILDASGKEIVSDKVTEKQVYKANAANTMTDILTGVIKRGTGAGLGISNGMPCAGKTGTTNDKKDGWFCGFTPYFTTAVWIGYDQPQTVYDLYGNTYPGRTWHEFMNIIHESMPIIQFPGYVDENADKVVKPSATPAPTKPGRTQAPAVTDVPVQSATPPAATPTPDNTKNDTSNEDGDNKPKQSQPPATQQ